MCDFNVNDDTLFHIFDWMCLTSVASLRVQTGLCTKLSQLASVWFSVGVYSPEFSMIQVKRHFHCKEFNVTPSKFSMPVSEWSEMRIKQSKIISESEERAKEFFF